MPYNGNWIVVVNGPLTVPIDQHTWQDWNSSLDRTVRTSLCIFSWSFNIIQRPSPCVVELISRPMLKVKHFIIEYCKFQFKYMHDTAALHADCEPQTTGQWCSLISLFVKLHAWSQKPSWNPTYFLTWSRILGDLRGFPCGQIPHHSTNSLTSRQSSLVDESSRQLCTDLGSMVGVWWE